MSVNDTGGRKIRICAASCSEEIRIKEEPGEVCKQAVEYQRALKHTFSTQTTYPVMSTSNKLCNPGLDPEVYLDSPPT